MNYNISVLLLVLIALAPVSCHKQQEHPNVILCMADDLGWGDVGYNGNKDVNRQKSNQTQLEANSD